MSYAWAMAVTAGLSLSLAAVTASFGRERKGIVYGQGSLNDASDPALGANGGGDQPSHSLASRR
jgi:hypothetical protein